MVRRKATTNAHASREPNRIPDDVVYQIRAALKYSSATRTELARRFGVSRMAIWRIARRRKVDLSHVDNRNGARLTRFRGNVTESKTALRAVARARASEIVEAEILDGLRPKERCNCSSSPESVATFLPR